MTRPENDDPMAAPEAQLPPPSGSIGAMPLQAEGRWLWRRSYVFASSLGLGALLLRLVDRAEPADLPGLVRAVTGLMALLAVLYLVGPTAQQLIAFVAQLRSGRAGAA